MKITGRFIAAALMSLAAAVASADTRQLGILTPPEAKTPRINAPSRYGARPGHPILFKLPVTGEEPIATEARGLPEGAQFNLETRLVTGEIAVPGEYPVVFTAWNAHGKAEKTVTFVIGEKICLTPPMGYNAWNAFAGGVSEAKMRIAADKMIEFGLDRHGYSYCNIDDFWQKSPSQAKDDPTLSGPERHEDGTIWPNSRFPNMKGLADYIHSKGLKAGLYSSPGPYTCGGCTGSWLHELQDAKTYAQWGYDYLKYDWCSYSQVATGKGREYHTRPYFLMGRFLRMQPRDIVFSLCQYGECDVATWGEAAGGQCWRVSYDVKDRWEHVIERGSDACEKNWFHSKPGCWNDADMLVLGRTVWSKGCLTQNECYTHMSLWCMMASPLMIGCDLSLIDDFTLSLLTNDEVLAIDQDELGAAAARVLRGDGWEIWARPLVDGSSAFALVNTLNVERVITFSFAALGMRGKWKVRDLWRQKDEGEFEGSYGFSIPGHATHLVKFFPGEGAGLKPCLKDIRDNAWRLPFDSDRAKAVQEASSGPCSRCD
ncbi:MAG: alpha-galactosidase [Kiritimatiellae bacterium]|nr:alpha-galactosidase [Kiritimatiellia bacterium]